MAQKPFRLNRAGVGKILKSDEVASKVTGVAEQVGAAVRVQVGSDVVVRVDPYTTDRGAAAVVIADRHGIAMQASDGALTKAAAAVGLTVTSK
ncbi:hypothetical protein C8K38_111201 [Rhodococcus sp. OK611]|uniref:hypothetical protein n=1 Tax=unclassified Rhodococcus (in: high G+C Gram-positive bacteria) TaxID=192944 RepID=UPI000BCD8717|nr:MULTISPECIES: hypothetical protein [unclassified Rhodococcus (in: high G+C Gram-positive bacteria)]PTR42032.1 hypothetical protein C8K38_111201 [Rhodococcus sp. OK611]SNX91521.1 hypothetical protein SAMN05447004_11056 [Rhodococcus sp. OK270]